MTPTQVQKVAIFLLFHRDVEEQESLTVTEIPLRAALTFPKLYSSYPSLCLLVFAHFPFCFLSHLLSRVHANSHSESISI